MIFLSSVNYSYGGIAFRRCNLYSSLQEECGFGSERKKKKSYFFFKE